MGDEDERGRSPTIEGRYSNHFEVGFNAFEFLIDCSQKYGDAARHFQSRIVTTPILCKALTHMLAASLASYEAQFGTIADAKEPDR